MNRGDYYRGDYYRGDPGVFGFLKKVGKGIFGAAKGFLTGGLPGAISGAGSAVYSGELEAAGPRGLTEGELAALHTRDARLRAQRANAIAGAGGVMPGGSLPPGAPGMALMVPGGMSLTHRRQHPNRSTYVTRGGGTSRWPVGLQLHPKGSELVTSRRMNVGNARALRRSLRRLRGFAKLARKVLATSHQFKGGKRRAVATRR